MRRRMRRVMGGHGEEGAMPDHRVKVRRRAATDVGQMRLVYFLSTVEQQEI